MNFDIYIAISFFMSNFDLNKTKQELIEEILKLQTENSQFRP